MLDHITEQKRPTLRMVHCAVVPPAVMLVSSRTMMMPLKIASMRWALFSPRAKAPSRMSMKKP